MPSSLALKILIPLRTVRFSASEHFGVMSLHKHSLISANLQGALTAPMYRHVSAQLNTGAS